MIFDRQQSSFGIRIFLIFYLLYLLINLILFTNDISMKNQTISLFICIIGLVIFLIGFYSVWFENLYILYLIIIILIILLFHSFLTLFLVITKNLSFENSPYLMWNSFWLKKLSPSCSLIVCLLINLMMNISSLIAIFHLFASICPKQTL